MATTRVASESKPNNGPCYRDATVFCQTPGAEVDISDNPCMNCTCTEDNYVRCCNLEPYPVVRRPRRCKLSQNQTTCEYSFQAHCPGSCRIVGWLYTNVTDPVEDDIGAQELEVEEDATKPPAGSPISALTGSSKTSDKNSHKSGSKKRSSTRKSSKGSSDSLSFGLHDSKSKSSKSSKSKKTKIDSSKGSDKDNSFDKLIEDLDPGSQKSSTRKSSKRSSDSLSFGLHESKSKSSKSPKSKKTKSGSSGGSDKDKSSDKLIENLDSEPKKSSTRKSSKRSSESQSLGLDEVSKSNPKASKSPKSKKTKSDSSGGIDKDHSSENFIEILEEVAPDNN
ncbi:uncharacterized protein [Apostichopus japonicus]|uniref:uncharacterized protein n=1 Tax=Stichopus japonicus TaxID=307972 RepID=UPI003AB46A88